MAEIITRVIQIIPTNGDLFLGDEDNMFSLKAVVYFARVEYMNPELSCFGGREKVIAITTENFDSELIGEDIEQFCGKDLVHSSKINLK